MPAKSSPGKEHVVYHKDGSIWAKGNMTGGVPIGYWEWYRKDGTKLRSGYFVNGEQVGEWTTYDKAGKVFKVTMMKGKKSKDLRK
jgi:antitoxin component YwqK of YwqJK toxin-antitoxin module